MATRTKTTWWGFPTDTADVADNTARALTQQTVYAESTSRTFRSAIVEIYVRDYITATGSTITSFSAALSVGGATATTITETDDLTTSGEQLSAIYQFDFTAQFTSNFGTGDSNTVDLTVTVDQSGGTTLGTRNVSAILKLTYDFDDTDDLCLKTIMIPIESPVSNIDATGLAEIGTNQVPIITGASGVIREVSAPTIRDYFFILEGCENGNGTTTDLTLDVALDSDGATSFGVEERALGTDIFFRYVWSKKSSPPDTTATHAFKAACEEAASHHHMSILLVVTYEFTRSEVVDTTVSVQIPFELPDPGGTVVGDAQVIRIPVDIQEKGTVTLRQSGIQLFWNMSGAMTTANYLTVQVGSQTARSYTSNIATGVSAGNLSLMQRIDSGAAGGAGVTLARGINYVDVKVFNDAQRIISGMVGILYLTYSTDDVPSTGTDSCNRTIWRQISETELSTVNQYKETATTAMTLIGDASYWVNAASFWLLYYYIQNTPTSRLSYYAEVLSNEGPYGVADGWLPVFNTRTAIITAPQAGTYFYGANRYDVFKAHPSDPRLYRLDIEGSRDWRSFANRNLYALQTAVTYHSITFSTSGTVSGYAGTGVGLTVKVHDDTSGELLYTATTTTGGAYTVTGYDNTRDLYSEVFEDSTHVGRSAKFKLA